jgi:UDP-N-acetylmuramate dehydrogenase
MKISKKLSLYRTEHEFQDYNDILSEDQARDALHEAKNLGKPVYILGNGSNTLFTRKRVTTTVLKNSLPRNIDHLGGDKFYVSSSVLVSEVLKFCFSKNLACFYFLASVPAEVGGALAMNAGQGMAYGGESIMDFATEVRFIRDGKICVEPPDNLSVAYRNTIFTGQTNLFILGATFRFPTVDPFETNPIKERIAWAKKSQDLSKPNCGSVFKTVDMRILNRFRGWSIAGATFSKKTNNWITNASNSPFGINCLIGIVIFFHRLFFRKCETEVIRVK